MGRTQASPRRLWNQGSDSRSALHSLPGSSAPPELQLLLASKKTVGAYAVGRKPLSDFRVAGGIGRICTAMRSRCAACSFQSLSRGKNKVGSGVTTVWFSFGGEADRQRKAIPASQ